MTGCHTCGGFGDRHDPVAHGTEPEMGEQCVCGHVRPDHGRRDAQTAWQAVCYGDADCDCDDYQAADALWDEADYRRDGDQALTALAASIRDYRREGAE